MQLNLLGHVVSENVRIFLRHGFYRESS
jgi:hypothetical protein